MINTSSIVCKSTADAIHKLFMSSPQQELLPPAEGVGMNVLRENLPFLFKQKHADISKYTHVQERLYNM